MKSSKELHVEQQVQEHASPQKYLDLNLEEDSNKTSELIREEGYEKDSKQVVETKAEKGLENEIEQIILPQYRLNKLRKRFLN